MLLVANMVRNFTDLLNPLVQSIMPFFKPRGSYKQLF